VPECVEYRIIERGAFILLELGREEKRRQAIGPQRLGRSQRQCGEGGEQQAVAA